ncbi:hypothetical protein ACJIZ3_008419 [Penstemon smallii]|uniref:F-box domain-containing protein n=1 Tax=Penstemon smallii TaxID=265156 RepID=A0ABD3TB90_9LAMI
MTSSSDSVDAAPPWVELPREITATILHKLGTLDMLNAQAVCTTWRSLCEDPVLWRSIDMAFAEVEMCCLAVDRSQGQLNDIKIRCFGTDEMLLYISQRSGGLRCLILESCYDVTDEGVIEAVKNLPLLEELHIYYNLFRVETIETVGRICLNLKSFRFNRRFRRPCPFPECDFEAWAIARNMPELRHLEIRGSDLTDQGLLYILYGCSKLESLDLRLYYVLNGSKTFGFPNHVIDMASFSSDCSASFSSCSSAFCGNDDEKKKFKLQSTKKIPTDVPSTSALPPPWTELPRDVTANILQRLGPIEILESAQKVCTTWKDVCTDPAMWRVIDMKNLGDHNIYDLEIMCRDAVDRSQGQLIEINIESIGTDYLIRYISERSGRLRSLQLGYCDDITREGLIEAVKNLPLLEELHLSSYYMGSAVALIETVGRSCLHLKSFKLNHLWVLCPPRWVRFPPPACDLEALAIAENMPGLRHLQLIGNTLTDGGLQAILDGCPNLESLDLRQCFYVDVGGNLRRLCDQRIKDLRAPNDVIDFEYLTYDDDDDDQYLEYLY